NCALCLPPPCAACFRAAHRVEPPVRRRRYSMTRKHKPQTVHKKRPPEKSAKQLKPAASEKAAAALASLREKERARAAPPAKKGAVPAKGAAPHGKVVEVVKPEARSAGGKGAKLPLGIERRVPVMPEDRQSQLKLLIARGKEQGYLTYAQVN